MKNIKEEMPVNNSSQGNVAGLGSGNQGEPGINKKRKIMPFLLFISRRDGNK